MKKFFISLLILAATVTLKAQNNSLNSVSCIAYWKKGDVKTLKITKSSQSFEKDKQEKSGTNTYKAIIKIIDSSADSYTIEWSNKNIFPELTDSLSNLFLNLKVVYKTDGLGAFDSLVNYEELQRFINMSVEQLGKQAANKPEYDSVMEKMKPMFQGRQNIESLVLRDITMYHAPFGAKYFSQKQKYPTQLPNALGGDPFPAIITMYVAKKDSKAGTATIVMDQEIDKDKAAKIIKDFVKKLAPEEKIKDEELPSYISIDSHTEFDIVLSTGWIERVYAKRVAKSGDFQKIEIYEMVLE